MCYVEICYSTEWLQFCFCVLRHNFSRYCIDLSDCEDVPANLAFWISFKFHRYFQIMILFCSGANFKFGHQVPCYSRFKTAAVALQVHSHQKLSFKNSLFIYLFCISPPFLHLSFIPWLIKNWLILWGNVIFYTCIDFSSAKFSLKGCRTQHTNSK